MEEMLTASHRPGASRVARFRQSWSTMPGMKKALLVGLLALLACDENKTAAVAEAAAPKASAMASAVASSNPLPAPPKKKEWKCGTVPNVVDFAGDEALEKEVRLKLAKPQGVIAPSELA